MYLIAGLFNIFHAQYKEIEIDLQEIFDEFETDINILSNPVAKLNAGICGRYFEQLVKKTKNSRVGLESGFLIPFTLTATLFNLYHESNFVRDLFIDLERFDSIANDISTYAARVESGLFYYEISAKQEFAERYPVAARQWNELQYGITLQYAYSYTGRFLQPVLARSIYSKEGRRDKLEDYLNCPVEFSQDNIVLAFNESILNLPIITMKKELFPIFENVMGAIEYKQKNNELSGAIRRYLMHSLSTSGLGLRPVAKRFNMSERNIQRKLKTEGTSYQQILDNLRMDLSQKYLHERIALSEIAFLLGFESQSAFNKFFKKHFQATPGQF